MCANFAQVPFLTAERVIGVSEFFRASDAYHSGNFV